MTQSQPFHSVVHAHRTSCSPASLYDLVADVSWWPALFEPTVNVETLDRSHAGTMTAEKFNMTALVNSEVRQWTSRRELDPLQMQIRFWQVHSRPPVSSMAGVWTFRAHPDGGSTAEISHNFSLTDETSLQWVLDGLDANSERELAALATAAEGIENLGELRVFTRDVIPVEPSIDLNHIREFIVQSDRWPDRLPHVLDVDLQNAGAVQTMGMTSVSPNGEKYSTKSIRLVGDTSVVYKQLAPPPALLGHCGEWIFETATHTAVAVHRAIIAPHNGLLPEVLSEMTLNIKESLKANSRSTLKHAINFASELRSR